MSPRPAVISYPVPHAQINLSLQVNARCECVLQSMFNACVELVSGCLKDSFGDSEIGNLPDCDEFTTRPCRIAYDIDGESFMLEFTVTTTKKIDGEHLVKVLKPSFASLSVHFATLIGKHDLLDSLLRRAQEMAGVGPDEQIFAVDSLGGVSVVKRLRSFVRVR